VPSGAPRAVSKGDIEGDKKQDSKKGAGEVKTPSDLIKWPRMRRVSTMKFHSRKKKGNAKKWGRDEGVAVTDFGRGTWTP